MGDRLRVVVDATSLGRAPGNRGIGTYLRQLLAGLAPIDDLDVNALVVDGTPLPDGVTPLPVRRRAPGRLQPLEQDLLLPADLRRARGRVVHSAGLDPPRRWAGPWVQTLFDVIPLVADDPALRGERRRWIRQLAPRLRRADALVAISRHSADEGIRVLDLDPARVHVIHLGIDPRFSPGPAPAPEEPYVLVVSEYSRRKGFDDAFAAIAAVADAGLPHRLRVAGHIAPWIRSELESLRLAAPRPDRIDLLGYVDDLVPEYRAADAVLVTSRAEGFGLPALEAMACGTPVVAYANTALAEVVGDGGVLVDDGDVGAAAGALRSVLTEPGRREELRAAGLARAQAFDRDRSARAHADVYRSVAS